MYLYNFKKIILILILLNISVYAEDDIFSMYGNRIINDEKEKIKINEIDNIKDKDKITVYGKIKDFYGDVGEYNKYEKDQDTWQQGDVFKTTDGIVVLSLNKISKIVLMENSLLEIKHSYIKLKYGKIYFDIKNIDNDDKSISFKTNFAKILKTNEAKGIIEINEYGSQIKIDKGIIKLYESFDFFENYNITNNYILLFEFEDENSKQMKLVDKQLFYDKSEFTEIEKRYLSIEKEITEEDVENTNKINNYLKGF